MKPIITAREHYDRLAEMGNGIDDPPFLQEYMARWDGPRFWDALGDLNGKDVLEVGIGFGRIAKIVLKHGCRSLTGLDVSPGTIAAARMDLAEYDNVELVLKDIVDFVQPVSFDAAISILTMMHVEDKQTALRNIVDSLRPGGRLVLSIDNSSDSIDFGPWKVMLYPWAAECYVRYLGSIGCRVADPIPLIDSWVTPEGQRSETFGREIATIIKAVKG